MSERVRAPEVLFQLSGVGVVETEMPSGRLRRANAAFCEMVGYGEAELRGLTYLELTHPDDRARDAERFAALGRGEHRSGASLTRVVRKDGSVIWLELHVTLVGEGDEALNLTVVNDVTERKRVEEASSELTARSERQTRIFDTVLSTINDFIYVFGRDGRFTYSNQSLLELLGLTSAEVIGKNFFDLGYPEDLAARLQSQIRQVFETKKAVKDETPFTSPTGKDGFYEYIFNPIFGADGLVESVAGSTRDITERKQTEAALRASEEQQAFLLALSDELRPLTAPGEIAEAAARRLAERLEVSRVAYGDIRDRKLRIEREYSRGVPSILGEYDMEAFGDDFLATYRSGALITSANVAADARFSDLVKSNSAMRALASFVDVVLFEEEHAVSIFIVHHVAPRAWTEPELNLIREVAERVRTAVERARGEAALRASEARYRIALEAAELATWDWHVEADRVIWNEQHYLLFGLEPTPGDETAASFLRFVHPDDLEGVKEALGRALREGVYRADFRIVRADDAEERWMSGYGRVVEQQGQRATRMTGVVFDITERKEAEKALRALNETLEQRVQERTEALRASERRFSQAFYVNPIPACMTTFGRETFVEVNDAFLELSGYTKGEVAGKTSRELAMWSAPDDQKKLSEAQQNGRGFRNLELRLRTKDGAVKTILMSAETIELNGEQGYLKMFYDITARKRTEEQLHQAIQSVMADASWFSRSVLEQLSLVRSGDVQETAKMVELSKRERQVLERLAGGASNDAIAAELGLSAQTIRNYVSNVYDKLGVHSRAEAVVWARERGIIG